MRYQVICECGFTAEGTQEELIPIVQQHGADIHGMNVTPEQVVAQLKPIDA